MQERTRSSYCRVVCEVEEQDPLRMPPLWGVPQDAREGPTPHLRCDRLGRRARAMEWSAPLQGPRRSTAPESGFGGGPSSITHGALWRGNARPDDMVRGTVLITIARRRAVRVSDCVGAHRDRFACDLQWTVCEKFHYRRTKPDSWDQVCDMDILQAREALVVCCSPADRVGPAAAVAGLDNTHIEVRSPDFRLGRLLPGTHVPRCKAWYE